MASGLFAQEHHSKDGLFREISSSICQAQAQGEYLADSPIPALSLCSSLAPCLGVRSEEAGVSQGHSEDLCQEGDMSRLAQENTCTHNHHHVFTNNVRRSASSGNHLGAISTCPTGSLAKCPLHVIRCSSGSLPGVPLCIVSSISINHHGWLC